MVVVTHNAPIAEMADTVVHMRDGKIHETKRNEHPRNVEEILW